MEERKQIFPQFIWHMINIILLQYGRTKFMDSLNYFHMYQKLRPNLKKGNSRICIKRSKIKNTSVHNHLHIFSLRIRSVCWADNSLICTMKTYPNMYLIFKRKSLNTVAQMGEFLDELPWVLGKYSCLPAKCFPSALIEEKPIGEANRSLYKYRVARLKRELSIWPWCEISANCKCSQH